MSKLTKYLVVRGHSGDRDYAEGEERTAVAADVKHLIPHVLTLIGDADEAPTDEPAEPAAPVDEAKPKGRKPATGK